MKKEFAFQWHITDLCNLRCRHCYQDRFDDKRDIPIVLWKNILEDMCSSLKIRGYKGLSINITGGEPLISPLFFPLMRLLEEEDLVKEVNLITNGIGLKELYPRLNSYKKLKYIKVSLEGPIRETNDLIRGAGNFDRVIENIQHISERIILMFTLTRINYDKIEDMYKLGTQLGVKGIILERFVPLGKGRDIIDKVLETKEWMYVLECIGNLFDISPKDLLPYRAFFLDIKEGEILGALCNLGDEAMCLMPNGIVYPCRRLPIALGDLKTEVFYNILDRLGDFRSRITKDLLKGKCHLCEIEECIGCRALAYALTGDVYSEDIQCPKDIYARISEDF